MNQDRTKWNKRYLDKTKGEPTPPVFLVNNWQLLTPGRVLDVAAGDGAASLFLAHKTGFRVTAADIAEEGLKRLSAFAAQRDCAIETCCIDLDQAEQVNSLGCFDSVVISYFKPSELTVSEGDTVIFRNIETMSHPLVNEELGLDTGEFTKGEHSFTFDQAGSFTITNTAHGTIITVVG